MSGDCRQTDLEPLPDGVWYRKTADGFEAGATIREWSRNWRALAFDFVFVLGLLAALVMAARQPDFFLVLIGIGSLLLVQCVRFGWQALRFHFGVELVRVAEGRGLLFSGVGKLGRRRHFLAHEVQKVTIVEYIFDDDEYIVLDCGEDCVGFGAMCTEPRRKFLADVLRRELCVLAPLVSPFVVGSDRQESSPAGE